MATLTPREYQIAAAYRIATKNSLLADECGLGKTLTALIALKTYVHDYMLWRALVVCPLRLISQWVAEAENVGLSAKVIPYGFPVDVLQVGPTTGLYVTHYEAIREYTTFASLTSKGWDMIIVDEAHRIKNRKATQTLHVKRIPAHRRLALSGTPMEKTPADLWSILNWLYPDSYKSYWQFTQRFVLTKNTPFGSKIVGVKNERALGQQLATVMIRRTKKDVAPELPPRITQIVPVELEPTQRIQYDIIRRSRDIVVDVEDQRLLITNTLAQIIKLQQITSCPRILNLEGVGAKIDWVLEWIGDNPSTKAVIFTRFRDTAFLVQDAIGADRCDILVGGGKHDASAFLAGKKDYLVGTIDAMGEGLNLQIADVAIFVDLHWSTLKMTQAIDRIHRMNITGPKLIYYLIASKTVDELVLKALTNKWSDIELVMNAIEEWKEEGG